MRNDLLVPPETPGSPPRSRQDEILAPLRLDPDEYREDLAEFELTEEQQDELLSTLWHIMRTFVEIGFGLDSVQMFSTTANGLPEKTTGQDSGNTLGRKHAPQRFNKAAIPAQAGKDGHD